MCRYTLNVYRDAYVCLDCRKSWKGPLHPFPFGGYEEGSLHCGICGQEGANIGKDYRVPKRRNVKAWKQLAELIASDHIFQTCGCSRRKPVRVKKSSNPKDRRSLLYEHQ